MKSTVIGIAIGLFVSFPMAAFLLRSSSTGQRQAAIPARYTICDGHGQDWPGSTRPTWEPGNILIWRDEDGLEHIMRTAQPWSATEEQPAIMSAEQESTR